MNSSAPQFRQDPISLRWVIIAGDRDARPNDFEIETARIVGARRLSVLRGL